MKKEFKATIGLEIHIQLDTRSKMFCACSNVAENKLPNSVVCPVCMGMPGTLPVPNEKAIEWSIKTALALSCKINQSSKFDRKNYFYPDLPKGYQISQYDLPIGEDGNLEVVVFFKEKNKLEKFKVGIERLHLEEDAGKLTHLKDKKYSLVDFNRTGTPLMEIVTRPEIHSSIKAKAFLETLRLVVRYLGVSRADMEKGHLRCDANISLASKGSKKLGEKVEIKNLNSFRAVQRALEYEEKRQKELLNKNKKIVQETRGWDEKKNRTVPQRTKEEAPDYRYFPEPDIPEMNFTKEKIEEIKNQIPTLPQKIFTQFLDKYKLDFETAQALLTNKFDTFHFKKVVELGGEAKKVARLIIQKYSEFRRSYKFLDVEKFGIIPQYTLFASTLLEKFNNRIENEVLKEMFATHTHPEYIVREKGIKSISSDKELSKIVATIIEKNPKAVQDFKAGKEKSIGFLMGQVMAKTKGQANPQKVNEILKKKLK